jgi:hypothetical protein
MSKPNTNHGIAVSTAAHDAQAARTADGPHHDKRPSWSFQITKFGQAGIKLCTPSETGDPIVLSDMPGLQAAMLEHQLSS